MLKTVSLIVGLRLGAVHLMAKTAIVHCKHVHETWTHKEVLGNYRADKREPNRQLNLPMLYYL